MSERRSFCILMYGGRRRQYVERAQVLYLNVGREQSPVSQCREGAVFVSQCREGAVFVS